LDEAAEYFVRLTQGQFSGARAAAYLFPESATPTRNARYTRAVHVLDTALSLKLTEGQRLVLELLRYDVFRRLDDQRMADSAAALAKLPVPAYMATTKVCGILESALRTAMSGGAEPAEFVTLNQAIERCPDQSLPGLLLLKGDVLLGRAQTRDEIIRASWPYMRVAIHMPDGPRAAEALFRTGQALARIGSHDRAQSLLAECLAHPQATEEIKRQAQALQTSGQNAKRPSP
jgi:hypothetical protein